MRAQLREAGTDRQKQRRTDRHTKAEKKDIENEERKIDEITNALG